MATINLIRPTVLVALDAIVELLSRKGLRQMKLADFLKGSYETALERENWCQR